MTRLFSKYFLHSLHFSSCSCITVSLLSNIKDFSALWDHWSTKSASSIHPGDASCSFLQEHVAGFISLTTSTCSGLRFCFAFTTDPTCLNYGQMFQYTCLCETRTDSAVLILCFVYRIVEFAARAWQQSLCDPESAVARSDLLSRAFNHPARLRLHGRRHQEPGLAFHDVVSVK